MSACRASATYFVETSGTLCLINGMILLQDSFALIRDDLKSFFASESLSSILIEIIVCLTRSATSKHD